MGDSEHTLPPPTADDVAAAATDPEVRSLVGVSFDQPLRAQEFLLAISRLRHDGALALDGAVIVAKDEHGHTRVTETIDPTPAASAVTAAMWSGLLGLIVGGPVGWLAGLGIGAGAGAVAAKVIDLGIPDEWVDWFKLAVEPGSAAVVVLVRHLDLGALAKEAHRFPGAELLHSTLPPGAIDRLATAFESG